MAELTTEQVQGVINTVEENVSPAIQQLRSIQNGEIPEELLKEEQEEPVKYAQVDPITGQIVGYQEAIPDNITSAEDIDDVVDEDLVKELDKKIDDPEVVAKATKAYVGDASDPFSTEDLNVISRLIRKRSAGEKVRYEEAPIPLQIKIMDAIVKQGSNYVALGELKNQLLESFLDNVQMQIYSNEYQKNMQDLSSLVTSVIKKEGKEIDETSRANQDKVIRETLPKLIEKFKDEKPELADVYRGIIDGYEQAYSMERMFQSYYSGKPKIKKIDIEKLDRLCFEFDDKYKNSKWNIKDVSMLVPILDRNLRDDIDIKDIKAFVAVFIKYTIQEKMTPKNIVDHAFMSFFINNIAALDIYKKTGYADKESEYYEQYLKNIYRFIDVIAERRKAKEQR